MAILEPVESIEIELPKPPVPVFVALKIQVDPFQE